MHSSSVDLPLPVLPIMTAYALGGTAKLISASAKSPTWIERLFTLII